VNAGAVGINGIGTLVDVDAAGYGSHCRRIVDSEESRHRAFD